jgi:hypothetical protein
MVLSERGGGMGLAELFTRLSPFEVFGQKSDGTVCPCSPLKIGAKAFVTHPRRTVQRDLWERGSHALDNGFEHIP